MNPPMSTPRPLRRAKTNLSSDSDKQQKRDPVKVFCRLRNLKDNFEASCIKLLSPTVLCVSCPTESRLLKKDVSYSFEHIFTSYSSQKEIFDHVALPLLNNVLRGKNGLLFTYGVTGSGKTYTLTGDTNNPGIMPRCIDTIFNTIGDFQAPKFVIKLDKMNCFEVQTESEAYDDRIIQNKTGSLKKKKNENKVFYANDGTKILGLNETNLYAIFISYVEIYNNTVYDLLDESSRTLQSKILREDAQKNIYVNGVIELEVKSSAEAFELFNVGQKRKRVGHTMLNSESSRSHSIFNIRVVQLQQEAHNSQGDRVIPEQNMLIVGQLSLVDLAGSERSNRSQTTGARLKEASCINNSLMSLRNCIDILRDNQLNNANRLVPYRDSRLTMLFKNYFEGEGCIEMIVCVNPSSQDYEETLQVMKFAEISQDVKTIQPESRYTPYRKVQSKPRVFETPKTIKKTKRPLVFGPEIPYITLNIDDFDGCKDEVAKLLSILQTRKQKGAALEKSVIAKERHFRKRLVEVDNEHTLKESELHSAQQQLKKDRKKIQNLETKVLEMEKVCDSVMHKNEELTDVIRSLRNHLDEKDLKLNQNLVEREKQKQKMALKHEKLNQELDKKLRLQRQHLEAVMQSKDVKLQKVRDILSEQNGNIEHTPRVMDAEVESQLISEVQMVQTPVAPKTPHRRVAVSNRRRSKSVGEVWLEHNSVRPVPLGTVLQPAMKKRKSVTKLSKASDVTNPKQSKYCLIAQEADTDGEIETKVYKGDIVPTCGGGAQVIFNDVERLKQESPVGTPQR